jgi:hypothetical protein
VGESSNTELPGVVVFTGTALRDLWEVL